MIFRGWVASLPLLIFFFRLQSIRIEAHEHIGGIKNTQGIESLIKCSLAFRSRPERAMGMQPVWKKVVETGANARWRISRPSWSRSFRTTIPGILELKDSIVRDYSAVASLQSSHTFRGFAALSFASVCPTATFIYLYIFSFINQFVVLDSSELNLEVFYYYNNGNSCRSYYSSRFDKWNRKILIGAGAVISQKQSSFFNLLRD